MPAPKKPEPTHILSFATNSLRNTTISVDDDSLYYEVVTRDWHPHLTKIFKLDKEARQMLLVGEIEREPGQEARVRMGNGLGDWMPLDDFLLWDSKERGGLWATAGGDAFRWKNHKRRLQLVKTDDAAGTPLAKYVPYTRHFLVLLVDRRAPLEVKDEALAHMDHIIMSYLIVERKRRDHRMMKVKLARQS